MIEIQIIPAFEDNYIYLVQAAGQTAVIDPGEAGPVLEALRAGGHRLDLILVTHPHRDHIAGLPAVKQATGAQVIGPDDPRIPGVDRAVGEGDAIAFGDGVFSVLATPGHGDRDVSYWWTGPGRPGALFCGDTLFVSGCGRVFEGRPPALWASLQKLAALPEATEVYCGHEYTLENLRFARSNAPDDPVYRRRAETVRALRAQGRPSVPSTIGQERESNPFLRCASVEAFTQLRRAKDDF